MNNYNFDPITGQPIQSQKNENYTELSVQPRTQKKNKKIIILTILILFTIAGLGVLTYFKFLGTNSTKTDLNIIFDPNKPIVINNNGKYGYITSEGKILIEPQYKTANEFYGDYAVVSVETPEASNYNNIQYQIIDKNGNVKLTSDSYKEPQYYSNYDVWVIDETLYDSNLNKVFPEEIKVEYIGYEYFKYRNPVKNEAGIMTYNGKKIFTMPVTSVYVDISANEYNKEDLYASVKTYGDPDREVIISLKTGDILFTSEDAESFYISEDENGIFHYYNHTLDDGYENRKYLFFIDNKLAYETTETVDRIEVYDYQNQILEIEYDYDYETLGKSQRIYYYDVKNKKMLESIPESSVTLEDLELDLIEQTYGFKEYSIDAKYGIKSGEKVIVPCEYDDIEYFDKNIFNYMKSMGKELVLLRKNSKSILYNMTESKAITTFDSGYIYKYDYTTFINLKTYNEDMYTIKGYTIYNLLSDKSMDFDSESEITIGSNYIIVTKDNKKTYYNTDFKQIYVVTEQ